jgi:hypothetical protein
MVGAMALLASPAAAHGPIDVDFNGGSIAGLWEDDARTEFAFDNLHYEFDECEAQTNELTCTWSIDVTLHLSPAGGCPPVDQEEIVIWSSGEQSGNSGVDSGPQAGEFPACRNHALTVSHRFHKTYGPWEGEGPQPFQVTGGGGSFGLLPVGAVAEAEQRVIEANPAASVPPMSDFTANSAVHQQLRISADCRSLYDEQKRYAFKFRRLGCWKASRLVRRSWTGATPRGYRCTFKADRSAGRCIRKGQPKKVFAWHPPRKRVARD